jgi:hypothetical protein
MKTETAIPQNTLAGKPLTMFRAVFAHGSLYRLWARLTHQGFRLIDLDETLKDHPLEASHYAGMKTVSIDRIRGTEGKSDEFDANFNPTQERTITRWIGIALEKLRGHELPPVDLIQVDDIYYVRDGHHRISVSRAIGQAYIDAEVTMMQLGPRSWIR